MWFLSARWGRRFEFWILMKITAKAFNTPAPSVKGQNEKQLLASYARFTAEEAKRALSEGRDMQNVHEALYAEAYTLGNRMRKLLRLKSKQDVWQLLKVLYQNIGIDLRGQLPGKLQIARCYFSQVYSPEICSMISFFDWGIFAGLCNGGHLTFTRRITEGAPSCHAMFKEEE